MYPASTPNPTPPSDGVLDLRCPLLPQTLMEAVALLANPDDIEADAVTTMVERDPMLMAQLQKTVNSAYYGLSRTITSPARAVMLLGPVTVVGLVAGMSFTRLRPEGAPQVVAAADRVVRHSLATAYLAQFLVEHVDPADRPAQSGEAYTAGLLHDLGKFVLLHNFPAAAVLYGGPGADPAEAGADLAERERALLGFSHTEAGAVAAERSNFPEALVRVVRLHHDAGALGDEADRAVAFLLRATAAASRGATALGYPAGTAVPAAAPALAGPAGADDAEDGDAVWAAVATQDLPHIGGPDAVAALVQGEGDRLRQYVDALMAPAA